VSENTVTSNDATRKNPSQGKFKSGIKNNKGTLKIDTNKHGIRRETNLQPKKVGRKKV
jgi:hypothetical protein